LPKYYFKPILEKVQEAYKENSEKDYSPEIDIESNVRLVIEAPYEINAVEASYGFIDVRMWELDKKED
jgi:hypothetical protein